MDGAGPFIVGAMAFAFFVAGIGAWRLVSWLAVLLGTLFGLAAFLFWVPPSEWGHWAIGFLPFALVPALIGAVLGNKFKKKEVS